mmetsp:Transcript_167320/g.321422  ORF Transcript_167320/g.321422 Transcript_167320/m.321422 type:complete len:269 (-) Transcript_167320:49-855(-)
MSDGSPPESGPLRRMFSGGMQKARRMIWADETDEGTVRTASGRLVPWSEAPPQLDSSTVEKPAEDDDEDDDDDEDGSPNGEEAAKLAPNQSTNADRIRKMTPTTGCCAGCLPMMTASKKDRQSPKGRGKGRNKRVGSGPKHECQYHIGILQDDAFDVKRRIIGSGGSNMKEIVTNANQYSNGDGTKLRLRGVGSGFLEMEGGKKQESGDPLMLCITAVTDEAFQNARGSVEKLLLEIYAQYTTAYPGTMVQINVHEGRREGGIKSSRR